MADRPKLTLKKPLSLEKQSQIFEALKSLAALEPEVKKLSLREQKHLMQKDQQKKKEGIKETLAWLNQTYPLCFNIKDPKPLKIRIEEDIFKELSSTQSISKVKIRQAIHYYIKNLAYLKCLTQDAHRYDLQGQPVEEVTPEHKAYAQEKLERVKAAIEARKERASAKAQTPEPS